MRSVCAVLLTAIFVAGFASPSSADQHRLTTSASQQVKVFGVMDDNPVMAAAAGVGFTVVKKTVWFSPTQWHWESLDIRARNRLTQDMADARQAGISVILELFPVTTYSPPRGPNQQRYTCDLAKDLLDQFPETYGIEIGVEPNSYTFWRPQFYSDGTQASAASYEQWLATCYDKLKASHPDTLIIGGSLSSRGDDQPYKERSGTSPVLFLQKFCEAYKTSGRARPLMDWFDMHSYPDPEDQDPAIAHPYPSTTITIADYAKLEGLLGCFKDTAQPVPPVLWGEGGYNTVVPEGLVGQGKGYSQKAKPSSVKLIDEATQGRYVAQQIQMAYCQPNSVGYINFHFVDDPDRFHNWQSGFAYPLTAGQRSTSSSTTNYTLKQSTPAVRKALAAAASGTMKCGPPGSP